MRRVTLWYEIICYPSGDCYRADTQSLSVSQGYFKTDHPIYWSPFWELVPYEEMPTIYDFPKTGGEVYRHKQPQKHLEYIRPYIYRIITPREVFIDDNDNPIKFCNDEVSHVQ